MARRMKDVAASASSDGGSSFSARRMFAELANAPTRVLTGLVKEDSGAPTTILFSESPTCTHWVGIPEGVVVDYEFVRLVECGDHNHALVHLHLRDPSTPEEKAYLLATPWRDGPASVAEPGILASMASNPRAGSPMLPETRCVYDADFGWVIRGTRIPCPGA